MRIYEEKDSVSTGDLHGPVGRRANFPRLNRAWNAMSQEARGAYLDHVAGPEFESEDLTLVISKAKIDSRIVQEWADAGLVTVDRAASGQAKRTFVHKDAHVYTRRLGYLHTTSDEPEADLEAFQDDFLETTTPEERKEFQKIIKANGIDEEFPPELLATSFILSSKWPDWVASFLGNPTAQAIVQALDSDDCGFLVDRDELCSRIELTAPSAVEATLDQMIAYMAVHERLDPETLRLQVGLHPTSLMRRKIFRQKTHQEVKLVPTTPASTAPPAGLLINDLRVVLLELAHEPARLKSNREDVFAKDRGRLESVLEPWDESLKVLISSEPARRVDDALDLSQDLDFLEVQNHPGGKQFLAITQKGTEWLSTPATEQRRKVYAVLFHPIDEESLENGDRFFLGSPTVIKPLDKSKTNKPSLAYLSRLAGLGFSRIAPDVSTYRSRAEVQAVRDALYKLWSRLPLGQFFPLTVVVAHLSLDLNSPLFLGRSPKQLIFWSDEGRVAPIEDAFYEAFSELHLRFLIQQLIPFEAVRVGFDASGMPLIARTTDLDHFFDKKPAQAEDANEEITRVVVQPDFTVIVIGLDPAPCLDLSPFCERVQGNAGQGAVSMRITRESIRRGVSSGLKAAEIVNRLRKHAGDKLPENVARIVTEWADQIHMLKLEQVAIISFENEQVADRAHDILAKISTRLAPCLLKVEVSKLSVNLHKKLRTNGLILEIDPAVAQMSKKLKKVGWGRDDDDFGSFYDDDY